MARFPDLATQRDRRSHEVGNMRSKSVARSGERAITEEGHLPDEQGRADLEAGGEFAHVGQR
jgi:hypothetical protein